MQPQGQLQVLLNTIDYHLNPQAALDAPRWQWVGGKTIEVEPDMPQDVIDGLRARGHDIVVKGDIQTYGRGQIIGAVKRACWSGERSLGRMEPWLPGKGPSFSSRLKYDRMEKTKGGIIPQ